MTDRLPILVYHRIADEGAEATGRYRVSTAAFDEQLAYLRHAGYRTVGLAECREAIIRRRPLSGKCVLLTFDDGYVDFLEEAWPRLVRHGFGACLLVVTDRIGGEAGWLTWEQLETLAGEGVEIGSHSATHRSMVGLSNEEVVEEAARSRAALAERLGVVPEAFAYPDGGHDGSVRHLVGACGYTVGLTTEHDHARLTGELLALPRIEISGSMDPEGFARSLGVDAAGTKMRRGAAPVSGDQPELAYEPDLLPPLRLMRTEGIGVIEEWFRWAEEWSVLLRVYGGLNERSRVLEIGCGLGRIAFALRYLLTPGGTYDGFEIVSEKVEFLERNFAPRYPNFRFVWADVLNTYYNPAGATPAWEYRFPYAQDSFDLVFAASVFTHTLPDVARRYFEETARVLAPGGRAVFSLFLLDHYRPAAGRPQGFDHGRFDLEHAYGDLGDDFRIANPGNPEEMTGFRRALVEAIAGEAGLEVREVVPGSWSGSFSAWISTQDLVVLSKGFQAS